VILLKNPNRQKSAPKTTIIRSAVCEKFALACAEPLRQAGLTMKLRLSHGVFGIAFLIVSSDPESSAQSPGSQFETRVQLQVNRSKSTRIAGGDWDDKTDRISFSAKFINGDTRQAFDQCQSEFYVFAQSILNPRAFRLLQGERFTFSLPARGTHTQQTPEVVTKWDKTEAKFGAKYDGWVCVVRDAEGKVIMKKASSNAWLPVADRLNELTVGQYYDRQLKTANP
jgi:hypothetical protein